MIEAFILVKRIFFSSFVIFFIVNLVKQYKNTGGLISNRTHLQFYQQIIRYYHEYSKYDKTQNLVNGKKNTINEHSQYH